MKKLFNEFKEFAMRGNVLDMAVGVVIGSAFGGIVTSLVNDIFTPVIAALTSRVQFSDLNVVLKETSDGLITLNYGAFIQSIINFVIVAFCIFLVVKAFNNLNKLKKHKEEKAAEEPAKSPELIELEKIVELLKNK